jgi:hypothetical protein
MSDRGERPLPDDLLRAAEWLREARPTPDGHTLDRAKTRARARAVAAEKKAVPHEKGALLRSRIAITMILALGILMSATGATLAVSGLGESGDASTTQYREGGSSTETLGGDPSDPASTGSSGNSGASGGNGASGGSGGNSGAGDVQPAAQQAAGGQNTLPFTGFAAIPVLVGGVALLGSGLVLRRRSGRNEE